MQAIETYVIRTLPVQAIDAREADPPFPATDPPDRDDLKAALRFDRPIIAAEVLVGPPDAGGRYALVAGHDRLARARADRRAVVLAAVVPSREALERAARRWRVYHDAA